MSNAVATEIEARGGAAAVAREVGQTPGAVRQWKRKGHFPRSAWPEIQLAYRDLTLERLLELEAANATAGVE